MWYPLGMPCTDKHPPEGMVMNQDEKVGWTTMPIWDEQNQYVRCQITLQDGTTVKKVQDGNTDVSIGFFCDLHEDPGTFGQDAYEAVQRNIVFNHLAVGLDKGNGRCPDGTCGIMTNQNQGDSADPEPEAIDWSQYNHLPCVGDTHYNWLMDAYDCVCLQCGYKETTNEHCADIKCPKCGGTMRRQERPGVGRSTPDAKLSAEERKKLPDSAFCGPGRSFPVPDCAHYTAALRMLGRYEGPGDKEKIKACIARKGKELGCKGAEDAENAPVKEGKYRLMPGYPDTHDHYVDLDADGNGTSTENDGHTHKVTDMNVELTEGHSHELVSHSSEEEPSMTDEEETKSRTGQGQGRSGEEEGKLMRRPRLTRKQLKTSPKTRHRPETRQNRQRRSLPRRMRPPNM